MGLPESHASLASGYKWVHYKVGVTWVDEVKSVKWYLRKPGLKGHTGKWSKWGPVQNDYQPAVEEWFCQSCGNVQPPELPPFLFDGVLPEVSIRVCPICLANGCVKMQGRR